MEPSNPYRPPAPSGLTPAALHVSPRMSVEPGSRIDFNRVTRFFFEDPHWGRKLLLGGLFYILSMALVGMFFVAGYLMELIRRSAAGEPYPLPEWDNLGDMFVEGVKTIAVYFLFIFPFIVLFIVPSIAMEGISEGDDSSPAMVLSLVLMILVITVVYVAVLVFFPSAVVRMAIERRFSAAFEIGENFELIRRNATNFVLAILFYVLATFLAQFGLLLVCIGIFPAAFWALCVGAYAFGEVVLRDPGRTPSSAKGIGP